ncbi:MAG: beta-N-acetylglucosaminidase domain-containing protein, partial [Actinobacteria bacterium]|nr:beta-N-acetylglucosaminidase domain-containing protein [Actinomycetota bacterium]
SYSLTATADGITVTAATATGLVRGATTARQLVWRDDDGTAVATGAIDDRPTVPLRMLAGWGLYRAHQMEWALEVALEGKYNRVLYNWWTATADERLGRREEHLVTKARDLGIELVVELRRQALGTEFSLTDERALEPLLRHYDDAVDRGFRAFGFLFDDTDHDPFDDEFAVLHRIVDRLTARLGHEPEFYFCPRFYWFPGEADYSWFGGAEFASMLGGGGPRTLEDAVARQRDYHQRLAAALPARTNVYLANWWSGTPADWSGQLADQWTDVLGRPPVFWDNQQQNDFRAAALVPVPLHQRAPESAAALAGYTLNSGRPLSVFAPSSITAGAWAWNPDGYDAATAFGAAIARTLGFAAVDALSAWCALWNDLLAPRTGMEHHYRNLRTLADNGKGDDLRARLIAIDALLVDADRAVIPGAQPMARDALAHLCREVERLLLDLALAELRADPDADEATAAEAEHVVAAIEAILVSRLPPVTELEDAAHYGLPDEAIPGVSWYLHFVAGPMNAGPRRLLASLRKRLTAE